MTKEQSAAFEEAWKNIKAPANETITSKWYFMQGCKAALSIAERKPDAVFESSMGWVKCHDGVEIMAFLTHMPDRWTFENKRFRVEFYKQDAGAGEDI